MSAVCERCGADMRYVGHVQNADGGNHGPPQSRLRVLRLRAGGAPRMTVTINGTEFEAHPVACPECGDEVDAQVVLLERHCTACGVGYGVFFPDDPDPEDAEIAYPVDGPAEVRAE